MVSDLVSQNINIFLRNAVKVTGVVVFMFSLSWQLSLVTFMGFPIIMMVSDIYGKYYKVGPPVSAGPWEHGQLPSGGEGTPWPLAASGGCVCISSCAHSLSRSVFSEHPGSPRHQDTSVNQIRPLPSGSLCSNGRDRR